MRISQRLFFIRNKPFRSGSRVGFGLEIKKQPQNKITIFVKSVQKANMPANSWKNAVNSEHWNDQLEIRVIYGNWFLCFFTHLTVSNTDLLGKIIADALNS